MSAEKCLKFLEFMKKFYSKCFFIGLIFLVIAAMIYFPCRCTVASFYQVYFGISPEFFYKAWVLFIGLIKTILIFFFLVPALSVHCLLHKYAKTHCLEAEHKKDEM